MSGGLPLIPRQVRLAGLALIVAGIICLYLSDAVARGWWQGTLQAFGVGFTVAGVVDVLVISELNARIAEYQKERQRALNRQAARIKYMMDKQQERRWAEEHNVAKARPRGDPGPTDPQ